MAKSHEETIEQTTSHEVDLFGEFHFKVDAKGRIALPAQFRKVLSKDLVVSRDPKGQCLYVFEPQSFTKWVDQVFVDRFGGYDTADKKQVKLRSKIRAKAAGVEVDSAGRISVKQELRDEVGIDKNVVITGNEGRFEIWDEDVYEKAFEDISLDMLYND